ncbi:MAG TPA: TetR/AcrR family transcriptional regulator [Flavobacteriia bacterium]|jgi:AcrR family transcriptional regulator|nr:TetR/AcrR family transcriptional regulator [Flavobacteriia bacterium]
MKNLQIHIKVSPELYLKNPDSSELGHRIIAGSIELINELGFEVFTFKKLGDKIGSPESSIYRYFESKHTLLIYLTSWFWSWVEYQLVFATANINSPIDKLEKTIKILTQPVEVDKSFSYINEVLLHKIIITESVKVYHTKDVDDENEKGYFSSYKQVVQRVSDMVLEINPTFKFPQMLISTVIEGANHQRYFAQHLPALTNVEKGKDNIIKFYTDLVFKAIK